jgi:hypothetical protein
MSAAIAGAVLLALPNMSTGALPALPDQVAQVVDALPLPAAPPPKQSSAPAPRDAEPSTTPPAHGTNPHGQGSVAVVDTNPDPKRPYSSDPTGTTDNEDIVVGRSRAEQGADGSYHGHVTVAALFGNEIVGVDSKPGEDNGPPAPLDALQTSLLDALCGGSGNQLCLSVFPISSTTAPNGSTNHFGVAHAKVGGDSGIDAGAAESNGNISSDGTCQTSHGDSSAADVKAGGQSVATVLQSSTDSSACSGQAPTQKNTSSVVTLGGTGVPIPAPGCADGTADTVTGVPTVLPIVCNGDDSNAGQGPDPYGVRDALDAFVLATGSTSVAKLTTSGSDSAAAARAGAGETPPQCSDGADNDGDGLVDAADPGCHSDGNAGNPASYVPSDNDETNGQPTGSSVTPTGSTENDNGRGGVEHTGGSGGNAPVTPAVPASGEGLPFTGTDVLTVALIGALLLAGGLALRTWMPRRRLQP